MPRKQRIEFPGAVYHIISRGNYRKELFLSENTGKAFERTIFETAERWEHWWGQPNVSWNTGGVSPMFHDSNRGH